MLEASLWLEQRLDGGMAWPAKDIEEEAEEAWHSKRTLFRARKAIGALARKLQGNWTWRLPIVYLVLYTTTLSMGVGVVEEHDILDIQDSLDSLGTLGKVAKRQVTPVVQVTQKEEPGRPLTSKTAMEEESPHGAMVIPCVLCGKSERWDDHGVLRCVACAPQPSAQDIKPRVKRTRPKKQEN
jgi:hypothetical protein